jgi:hypothetical protein
MPDLCVELGATVNTAVQEEMKGIIQRWDWDEFDSIKNCKHTLTDWLKATIPTQVSPTLSSHTCGICPFSKDGNAYVGLMIAPWRANTRQDFYADGVSTDTAFRFLFNCSNGIVLQLYSTREGCDFEIADVDNEIQWCDIAAICNGIGSSRGNLFY